MSTAPASKNSNGSSPGAFSAATFHLPNGRTVAVFNPCSEDPGRTKSDIGHELAHILLDHDVREIQQLAGQTFITCNPEQEEEATWLAGCLLLPRPLLLREAYNRHQRRSYRRQVPGQPTTWPDSGSTPAESSSKPAAPARPETLDRRPTRPATKDDRRMIAKALIALANGELRLVPPIVQVISGAYRPAAPPPLILTEVPTRQPRSGREPASGRTVNGAHVIDTQILLDGPDVIR